MQKQLSLNTKLAIQKARSDWKKLREIAKMLDLNINTVLRYCPPHKPVWRKATYKKYYEKNKEKIIARVKKNYHNKKSLSAVWK